MEIYLRVRRAHYQDGLSGREIARQFGISRDSVRKMLIYSEPPGYRRTAPIRRPKLDPFTEQIDQWLLDDKSRHRKQRHTAKRVFDRLKDECGFTGGYTIVKDYIREQKRGGQEMFVPLSHRPGHAQADFGEARAIIAGVEQKVFFFALDLPHSDGSYIRAYHRANTEAWLDGHVHAFAFFGKVPQSIVYDNDRCSVAKIMPGGTRKRTDRFSAMLSHYVIKDRSVTVTHPIYGIDTLIDIDGIWFQGEAAWYSIGDAVALTDGGTDGTIFNGTAGLDIFVGSDGNNTYNGGNGTEYDQVDYQGRLSDYTFTRNPDGTVTAEGFGNTDTLINIEGIWFQGEAAWYSIGAVVRASGNTDGAGTIRGTAGPDILLGTTGDDIMEGLGGQDLFVWSEGNDTFRGGGDEYDQVDYRGSSADYDFTQNTDGSVTVTGFGNTDTLEDIDGIWFQGSAEWASIDSLI